MTWYTYANNDTIKTTCLRTQVAQVFPPGGGATHDFLPRQNHFLLHDACIEMF